MLLGRFRLLLERRNPERFAIGAAHEATQIYTEEEVFEVIYISEHFFDHNLFSDFGSS